VRKDEWGTLDAGGGGKNYVGQTDEEADESPTYQFESLDTPWTDIEALAGNAAAKTAFRAAFSSPALAPFKAPRAALLELRDKIESMLDILKETQQALPLYNSETLNLLRERYKDTLGELKLGDSTKSFLKIGKMLDHLEYDDTYNRAVPPTEASNRAALPVEAGKIMDTVVPLCRALSDAQNALDVAWRSSEDGHDNKGVPFLHKLRWDLLVASGVDLGEEKTHKAKHDYLYGEDGGKPCLRTRFYFTHNSHLQNLLIALSRPNGRKDTSTNVANTPVERAVFARLGFLAHFVIQLIRKRSTGDLRVTCHLRQSDGAEKIHLFDLPLQEVDAWFNDLLKSVPDPSLAMTSETS